MSPEVGRIYHSIPKVDKILLLPEMAAIQEIHSRPVLLTAVRTVLEHLRTVAVKGRLSEPLAESHLSDLIRKEIELSTAYRLHPVVNGTGVVLHTNLGRSLLAGSVSRHVSEIAGRYCNLEMDIVTGERGERYSHVEGLLCRLTGAEAALVVNNNAAAVLLALSGLAAGREAVVSRGELVEIGGGFRVPDVMRQSCTKLREVGTTNRTHLSDYTNAISPETALLMKVHTSNFKVMGFTAEVPLTELVRSGKEHGITVMADIGSGCMIDLSRYGIPGESPVSEYLKSGVDILTCSGDKLLGGPQAGIILGKRSTLAELRRHPLLRALRIDKLTLAALEATLLLYLDERRAIAEIPTLKMLTASLEELQAKGKEMLSKLRKKIPANVKLALLQGNSQAGGGSLPLLELKSCLIAVDAFGWTPERIDDVCRRSPVPVVGRICGNRFLLDLRTIQGCDLEALEIAFSSLVSVGVGE